MLYGSRLSVARVLAAALVTTLGAQSLQAEFVYGIPQPMPSPFNLDGGYGYPWLTEDERDIYFSSDRPGPNSSDPYSTGAFDIWTAHRDSTNDPWGPFSNLEINTPEMAEIAPSFTSDMRELYFMRAVSPFGLPEADLYVSYRQPDNSWGVPEPLAGLNTSEGREAYPTISPNGLTLYFNINTVDPNPIYPNPTGLGFNTFVAHRDSRKAPFTAANSEFFFGGYGIVTPDGLTHITLGYPDFADYYGVPNVGDGDLYVRTRASIHDEFGPLQPLRPPINGSGQFLEPPLTGAGLECCATLSASGSTLYFTSIRPGTDASGPTGFVDLWQAPVAQSVPIKILPTSRPDPFNHRNVLPVAVLSTSDFDATQVNLDTLSFGDPLLIADGKSPVGPLSGSAVDVNGDGLEDVLLEFSMKSLFINEVLGEATEEGYLAGELVDGTVIAGRDIVPEPSGLMLIIGAALALIFYSRR